MKAYLIRWYPKFLLESLDQSSQMTDLSICEPSPLTIADQADSDGMGVVMPP